MPLDQKRFEDTEATQLILDSDLVLIDAENLSLNDRFMKYKPKDVREKAVKELIAKAIMKGVKNFYKPIGDVSFTDDGNGICYASGKKPAIGRSYSWYEKKAKDLWPKRNSRLGSKLEYGAFLGVLIKKLIEEGKSVKWAWHAVCVDSRHLGHYWNSKDAKHEYEPTGSRKICGFCDLANAYKILAWDNEVGGFWIASGSYNFPSYHSPIGDVNFFANPYNIRLACVGWLVFS